MLDMKRGFWYGMGMSDERNRERAEQAFKDCVRLRELAGRQTLTIKDNRDLVKIANRLHALAVSISQGESCGCDATS